MLRLLGVCLLVGSSVGGSIFLCTRATRRLSQVEGFLSLVRLIRLQVECFAMPLSTILARVDEKLLRQCGYGGRLPVEDLSALLDGCRIEDREAEEILRGFGEEFGRGYREEQVRGCEYTQSLLEERRLALAQRLPIQKKLYATLCLSGAIALVILFL